MKVELLFWFREYVSVRKDQNLVIRIDDRLVTPVSGFDCKDSLQIINEELCYNEVTVTIPCWFIQTYLAMPLFSFKEKIDFCGDY